MRWLLTGGAGYIGSHVARALSDTGRDVVVLDDLSTGLPGRLDADVPLVRASVLDTNALAALFDRYRIDGVIHLAGKKSVRESVRRPGYYYEHNVSGLSRLLDAMHAAGVRRLVFSSSAAVYGTADAAVAESRDAAPLNPYGATKLAGEQLIRRAGQNTGLRWMVLRYFNVAGAGSPELGDTTMSNLIPKAFHAVERGHRLQIFGDDYPTPDGSCVRDYVHVSDVADAHVAGAQRLEAGNGPDGGIYNLGRGVGVSVKELLTVVRDTTGHPFESDIGPRRDGDPPLVIAEVTAIEAALAWRPRLTLADMIGSAWSGWCARDSQLGEGLGPLSPPV